MMNFRHSPGTIGSTIPVSLPASQIALPSEIHGGILSAR